MKSRFQLHPARDPVVPLSSVSLLCTLPACWSLSSRLGDLMDCGGVSVLVSLVLVNHGPQVQE